jgi:hypothetical protein
VLRGWRCRNRRDPQVSVGCWAIQVRISDDSEGEQRAGANEVGVINKGLRRGAVAGFRGGRANGCSATNCGSLRVAGSEVVFPTRPTRSGVPPDA